MDLQSENGNSNSVECLRPFSELLYVGGCRRDVNTNEICLESKRDQRDNEKNTNAVKSDYNNENIYCNRFKVRNKFTTPPYGYNSMLSEPRNTSSRASSESICSRYVYTETKYLPDAPGNSKIENKLNQNEYNIKQKYDIRAKLTLVDSSERVNEELHGAHEKLSSDKTTYCRPVVNLYNQEILYKTMERNAKLQRLVTQLVIARQKEKDMENWNNYINDLRKKHNKQASTKRAASLQYASNEFRTLDTIEDNTKFTYKQFHPCQNLLEDSYKPLDIKSSCYDYYRTSNEHFQTQRGYNPFKTNSLCFPTSSQGRQIMLERERIKRLENRGYKPLFSTINEEKKLDSEGLKNMSRKGFGPEKKYVVRDIQSTNTNLECRSTQTEFQILPSKTVNVTMTKGCNTNYIASEKECTKEVRNQETAPESFHDTDNNLRKSSLLCIEKKLDNLIYSINNFIIEMKTKTVRQKYVEQPTKQGKTNVNYTKSDSCSIVRKEKIVCGFIDDSSGTTKYSSIDNFSRIQTIDDNLTKINDILVNEIGKTNLISETYHPCSVQISVTIPTKEMSTEVTRSLSKTGNLEDRNIIIGRIPSREDRRIAIAVNTDPLSLLAMLRVSTEETIKKLLSYVPTIDYYSYLSRLQGPSPRVVESHYVCNICGAAFSKPSVLTDHIQKHELGKTRDCCICRHMLDTPRRRPRLFKCEYCGQRFTRAYCCELHQEACARRVGKLYDVTSSLMLLR